MKTRIYAAPAVKELNEKPATHKLHMESIFANAVLGLYYDRISFDTSIWETKIL